MKKHETLLGRDNAPVLATHTSPHGYARAPSQVQIMDLMIPKIRSWIRDILALEFRSESNPGD
jgi:hypothetical protein